MVWHRRGSNPDEMQTLHPGVPSWLQPFLLGWVRTVTYQEVKGTWDLEKRPNVAFVLEYESAVRRTSSLSRTFAQGGPEALLRTMGETEFLDFVDFLLYKVSDDSIAGPQTPLARKLDEILANAGSEWKVGQRSGFASLEQRVPVGVSEAVENVTASSGEAGALLAEAWHAAFGRSPDAEEAYEKSIKAVEAAGVQVVAPKNSRATLGTMVRDMKAQGGWLLPIDESAVALDMAELLWRGQQSRHGGNGYRKPSQQEGEAAVLLAVPLVQWFTSGALAKG